MVPTGLTAGSFDFIELIESRAPWVFVFVLSLAFLLRHLKGINNYGPKAEAEEVKSRLAAFLRDDLRLGLVNQDKTLLYARQDRRGVLPRLRGHRLAQQTRRV